MTPFIIDFHQTVGIAVCLSGQGGEKGKKGWSRMFQYFDYMLPAEITVLLPNECSPPWRKMQPIPTIIIDVKNIR